MPRSELSLVSKNLPSKGALILTKLPLSCTLGAGAADCGAVLASPEALP